MEPIFRTSLVEAAAERLRNEIKTDQWAIGGRIPNEASLSTRLSVSRGTVREAVRVLVSQGLLETRQGSGTYVRSRTTAEGALDRVRQTGLRDLWEARAALDIEAARLAAMRHTPDDLARMAALLDARGNVETDGHDAFSQRDVAFHKSIVEASGNPVMVELYDFFTSIILETVRSSLAGEVPEPDEQAHRAIIDAIGAGDPDRAGIAARTLGIPALRALGAVSS